MPESESTWGGILKRASALRRRYAHVPDAPQSTWSLVNRAAIRFKEGGVPEAEEADHARALWSKAMVSVLNDLHRRSTTRQRAIGQPVELPDSLADSNWDDLDADLPEALKLLSESQEALARLDEEKALILAMRYFDEMTWEMIAESLGTSVTSVRRKWKVALTWLRVEIKRRGFDFDDD